MFTSRSWIEYAIVKSVNWHIENSIIIIKNLASTISNMNIPIKYAYFFYSQFFLSISSCYRHIVKETKSSHIPAWSMMTRWSDNTKWWVNLSSAYCPYTLYRATSCQKSASWSMLIFVCIILKSECVLFITKFFFFNTFWIINYILYLLNVTSRMN